jgi:hypothetical protein
MKSLSLLDSLTLCVCARRHDDQQPCHTRKKRQTCDSLSRTAGGCDESLDLLGSDPNIRREQRVKQQYFTYWLLRDLQG